MAPENAELICSIEVKKLRNLVQRNAELALE